MRKNLAGNRPLARGSLLALSAAVLFGLVTPAVERLGKDAGAFSTAALLYLGAALVTLLPAASAAEDGVTRRSIPRVLVVAVMGAALAPACFAWGVQRAGSLATALLLNFEAVFTIVLARMIHREPFGRRIALASLFFLIGGALLAMRSAGSGASLAGMIAILAATMLWSLDNTVTKPLSDLDPRSVVLWKSVAGAVLSAAISLLLRSEWPALDGIIGLVLCGALGYGLSLRLYLSAQREIGAGRTASLFAIGPFVGAAAAMAWGDRAGIGWIGISGICFAIAAWFHASERHTHAHAHPALVHEHAHSHDDGHHTHVHDSPVAGVHSHVHSHEAVEHAHPHALDVHHRHEH